MWANVGFAKMLFEWCYLCSCLLLWNSLLITTMLKINAARIELTGKMATVAHMTISVGYWSRIDNTENITHSGSQEILLERDINSNWKMMPFLPFCFFMFWNWEVDFFNSFMSFMWKVAINVEVHICREEIKPIIILNFLPESDGSAKGRHNETGTDLYTKCVTQVMVVTTKKESKRIPEKYFIAYLVALNFVLSGWCTASNLVKAKIEKSKGDVKLNISTRANDRKQNIPALHLSLTKTKAFWYVKSATHIMQR